MLNQTLKELKPIDMPNNVLVFEVEGLDCMGKETYCKSLANTIRGFKENVKVIELTFPDYTTIYGKAIAEDLRKPSSERSPQFMTWYYLDMYYAMARVKEEADEFLADDKDAKVVVICDRYVAANVIYNKCSQEVKALCSELGKLIPHADLTLFLTATTEASKMAHKALLSKKVDKDLNELDYSFQEAVATSIKCLYHAWYTPVRVFSFIDGLKFDNRLKAIIVEAEDWLNFYKAKKFGVRKAVEVIVEALIMEWVIRDF